jgi:prepilin-type N-terminal cleavage/methylation domain-containing protein
MHVNDVEARSTLKFSPGRPKLLLEAATVAASLDGRARLMITKLRAAADEESGFTLVELLIVIAILGILAGVVVFSIAGITDDGKTAACKTEASVLRTAQEAYYAKTTPKVYAADAAALKTAKLLSTTPTYATTAGSGASYTVTWTDASCGTVGAEAN